MISELPKNQKMSIIIRVNNTELPIDHWTNDPDVGGVESLVMHVTSLI